jgi:hypothetical protein
MPLRSTFSSLDEPAACEHEEAHSLRTELALLLGLEAAVFAESVRALG